MLKIYNEEEFYARIRNIDGIFLFGAGKRLGDVERFFQDRNISALVSGIIDNDVNKQGKRVQLWGKEYEIGGVKQLKADSGGNRLILITLEDYGDLLEELLQEESLRKEEIVCFSHMIALQKEAKSMHKRMPGIFRLEDKQLIPKKIHLSSTFEAFFLWKVGINSVRIMKLLSGMSQIMMFPSVNICMMPIKKRFGGLFPIMQG